MDDRELLHEYREHQSEKAFAELVARHIRLVYATALRLMGEGQGAQDVAQGVFLLLARKSWMVRDGNALPGWLYRATRRTALNELRAENRRRQRETEAMKQAELNEGASESVAQLLPLLDEALRQLGPVDQNLIILRFFEEKSLRETGAAAGLSEQAAHNRISRAIEKMRKHFARSGVGVAATVVETVLTAPSSQAVPAGLAANMAGAALVGSGGALSLTDLVLKFFLTMNTKTQIVLVLVMIGLLTLPFLRSANVPENKIMAAVSPAVAPPPAPVQNPSTQLLAQNQPVAPIAPSPTDTGGNPTSAAIAPAGQGIVSSQPIGGRPGSASNTPVTGGSQNVDSVTAQHNAQAHPLSHNLVLRIVGALGAYHSVDVTFTGVYISDRDISFLTPTYTRASGPYSGRIQAIVSQAHDGYQVVFVATMAGTPRGADYRVARSAMLKPGESTTASSSDGQIVLKATLSDVSDDASPAVAYNSEGRNVKVTLAGALTPKFPINLSVVTTVREWGSPAIYNSEAHQVAEMKIPNSPSRPLDGVINITVWQPDPNSNAPQGTYMVQYSLDYPDPTLYSLSMLVDVRCDGYVLMRLGQTVTIQNNQDEGSIQLSLSPAN